MSKKENKKDKREPGKNTVCVVIRIGQLSLSFNLLLVFIFRANTGLPPRGDHTELILKLKQVKV